MDSFSNWLENNNQHIAIAFWNKLGDKIHFETHILKFFKRFSAMQNIKQHVLKFKPRNENQEYLAHSLNYKTLTRREA
jgi:hypothetical protein